MRRRRPDPDEFWTLSSTGLAYLGARRALAERQAIEGVVEQILRVMRELRVALGRDATHAELSQALGHDAAV